MIVTKFNPQDYGVFIGIDVDSKSYAFTVTDHQTMLRSKKIPANPDMLAQYITKQFVPSRVLCGYEAGGTGYELYDRLKSQGIDCFVISPNAIPRASNAVVKNNRLDSQKIAQAMKSAQVSSIRVPSEEYRELRHLIRIYDNYSRAKSAAKQRIKAVLLFESLYKDLDTLDRRWTQRFIYEIKNCPSTPATRLRLDALLRDLDYARANLAQTLRAIKQFCYKSQDIRCYIGYLTSIPGIGIRIATYILGKIGDPELLRSPGEIGAFFGLTPREYSTGDKVTKGSISHAGNAVGRSLLVEAAWTSIRHDKELNQFYHRIRSRNPKQSGSQKAITAVARKLTLRIYAVLRNKREYVTR